MYPLIIGILGLAIAPPMRYTFGTTPKYAAADEGFQIFSIKIARLKEEEGLH